jgi:hypothetical protein
VRISGGAILGHVNDVMPVQWVWNYMTQPQLYFGQYLNRPDPYTTEYFYMDTIVAGPNRGWRGFSECAIRNGYRYICNFNEAVICAVVDKWISFGSEKTGGLLQSNSWFRPPNGPEYSKVDDWRVIFTRNPNIAITVRYGKRDDTCRFCREPDGCPADRIAGWEDVLDHNQNFLYRRHAVRICDTPKPGATVSYCYDAQISCIKVSLHHDSTCDLMKNKNEGYKFLPHESGGFWDWGGSEEWQDVHYGADEDLPALPARYDYERPMDFSNSEFVLSKFLKEKAVITSCNDGFAAIRDHVDDSTLRCVDRFSDVCADANGGQMLTSCSNRYIYVICDGLTDIDAFNNCFKQAVLKCQEMKVADVSTDGETTALQITDGDLCVDISTICNPGHFFNLDTNLCQQCESRWEGSVQVKKWDTIDGHEMECMGAYAGRTTCLNITRGADSKTTYLILAPQQGDKKTMETLGSSCHPCVETPPNPNQYIDPTMPCQSSWQRIAGYSLISNPSTIATCHDECPEGKYVMCAANHECKDCTCDEECNGVDMARGGSNNNRRYKEFCLVDKDICNGFNYTITGATCMNRTAVICPIGQAYDADKYIYIENTNAKNDPIAIYYDVQDLTAEMCYDCIHPEAERIDDNDDARCEPGWWWPGCQEAGLLTVPLCTPCGTIPNSVWDDRAGLPECSFTCLPDYYKKDDKGCEKCHEGTCFTGMWRPACSAGDRAPKQCRPCEIKRNEQDLNTDEICPLGTFKNQCDGTGYSPPATKTANCPDCVNICSDCNLSPPEGGSCAVDEQWETCRAGAISDTGKCVKCHTDTLSDIGIDFNYTGFKESCKFRCLEGYYMINKEVGDKIYGQCLECDYDYKGDCDVSKDESVIIAKCEAGTEGLPKCLCKPGFAAGETDCNECSKFKVKSGYQANFCRFCPPGYSGLTESGSTECIICPVNTWRGDGGEDGCIPCNAGTDGILGSTYCMSCESGHRANFVDWTGYVRNYNTVGVATNWTYWKGAIPNQCVVPGMSNDIQICNNNSDYSSIRWMYKYKTVADHLAGTIADIDYQQWTCSSCENGLAYSTNFEWTGVG